MRVFVQAVAGSGTVNVLLLRIEVSSVVSHVGGFVEANVGDNWFGFS